jgi:hypothetical protein
VKRLGGRDDGDLAGAEQHADREKDDHQRPHRRRAKRSSPGRPIGREGRAAGPQRADAQRDRRPEDVGQLDQRRLECVGAADSAGIGQKGWKLGPQAGADRRCGQPDAGCERDKEGEWSACRKQGDRDQQPRGNAGGGQQHRRLPAPINEVPEQRAAGAERDRVGAGDHAGQGE